MQTQERQKEVNAQRDRLQTITKEALETLCQSLENGKSEELVKYLDVMSRFPNYSFRNLMLIIAQYPEASRVMGFGSWKQIGRHVKKQEKAIRIFAPINLNKRKGERVAEASERNPGDADPTLIFRPVCVFDISQTEGEPLPKITDINGDPGVYLERLKRFAASLNIDVGYSDAMQAKGLSKCGKILLRVGLDAAVEFHVLAHEIAHELIHLKESRKTLSKKQAETEAEAVAFVVSRTIGLHTGYSSSDYIQLYQGNKETLCESLAVVQQTAARISGAILD